MCANNYAEWSSWVAESIKTQGAKGPRPQETMGPKGPWAQRLPGRRWAQVPLAHPRIPWTPPPWGPASCEKLKFTFRERIVTLNGRPGLAKPGGQCAGPASWLASLAGCQPGGPASQRASRPAWPAGHPGTQTERENRVPERPPKHLFFCAPS